MIKEGILITTSSNDTYGVGVVLDVGHYWVLVDFFDEKVHIPKHQLVTLN